MTSTHRASQHHTHARPSAARGRGSRPAALLLAGAMTSSLLLGAGATSSFGAPAPTTAVAATTSSVSATTTAAVTTATVVRRSSHLVSVRWVIRGRGSRPTSAARRLVTVTTRVTSVATGTSPEAGTIVRSATSTRAATVTATSRRTAARTAARLSAARLSWRRAAVIADATATSLVSDSMVAAARKKPFPNPTASPTPTTSPTPTPSPTATSPSPTPTTSTSPSPTPTVLAAPSGVAAAAFDHGVTVTWQPVSTATSYSVIRDGVVVAVSATTSFTDTGLVNGQTYSYTLTATDGTTVSAASAPVQATPFPPVPATPTGLTATAGNAQVALSWTASTYAASYKVLRNGVQVANPTGTSMVDSGLVNGTAYSYTVVATDMTGDSAATAAVSATPMPPLPAAPTGLTATAGNGQVALSWTASANATGYQVLRNGIVAASLSGTSYTDTGLTNGTTYGYTVVATNMSGSSAASAAVSATPAPPAPAAPTGLTATAGNTQVALSWTASTYATGYKVLRNGTQVATPTGTSYTDTGLTNGTAYSYSVVATNGTGSSAASAAVSATPKPPAPSTPTGLSATAGSTQVALAWSTAANATGYKVLRNGTQVGAPTGTSYTDTGLTNGTTYSYTVVATNMTADSSASAAVSATPAGTGIPLPSGWTRVLYSDEFSASTVDTSKWNVRNSTAQSNTKCRNFSKNISIANGVLGIRSGTDNTVDPATYPWTCGYIDSIGKFSVSTGYWEARMRFPWGSTSQGYWPAFWLRPDDGGLGEIDIMEAWAGSTNDVHQTLWRDYTGTPHVQDANNTKLSWYDATQWHTYAVQKEFGVMKFYIDGTMVWDASNSATWVSEAFSRTANWNIRINLQVGSGYGGNPNSSTNLSQTFDVDYVRVLGR